MKEILKGLAKFQAKNLTIKKDGVNPHYKSYYITLDSILDVTRPILSECGLVLIQTLVNSEKGFVKLVTKIYHVDSSEFIESVLDMPVPGNQSSQSYGMAVTYARRYSLATILGITADDDTDAEPEQPKEIDKTSLVKANIKLFSEKYPELTKRLADLPENKKLTSNDREALFGVTFPIEEIKNCVEGFLSVREKSKGETNA